MKRRKNIRLLIIFGMFVVLLLASHMTVLAANPRIDDIRHKGNGRIKVEFHGKVRYKNAKVTVKDKNGKKYKIKSIKKDSDEIRFTIVKYKAGKTYKIMISGVKKKGTRKYGKVSGRCTITPIVNSATNLSYLDALGIANEYTYLEGEYPGSGYYTNGVWEFAVYDKDGIECGTIRIDDNTGGLVYYEYRPVGCSRTFIFKDSNNSLTPSRVHWMLWWMLNEIVGA